jgi:hypothetical protein
MYNSTNMNIEMMLLLTRVRFSIININENKILAHGHSSATFL